MLFQGDQALGGHSAWSFLCRDGPEFSEAQGCCRQTS